MKGLPLPVFFVLLICAGLAWWLNRYLQSFIQPRKSLARLLLYLLTGMVLVFGGVILAVRFILWVFPPAIK